MNDSVSWRVRAVCQRDTAAIVDVLDSLGDLVDLVVIIFFYVS